MKIFLSWSGPTSHAVADVLRSWLPGVLPAAQPWLSSEDIPKGATWATELAGALESADFGILCITPDNLDARWLNFEAGALTSPKAGGRIAPILFGLSPSDISGPLGQYQLTVFESRDFLRLLKSINARSGPAALADSTLQALFAGAWPRLRGAVTNAFGSDSHASEEVIEEPSDYEPDREDDEVLELLANLPERDDRSWIDVDDIVHRLKLRTRRAEYILQGLTDAGYLEESGDTEGDSVWTLTQMGLEYVVESGLVDE